MSGPVTLTMPVTTLERLADATRTPLPWRGPRPVATHDPVPRLLVDALATFGRPQVLVTLDLLHPGGRLRSWQRLAAGRVTALSTAGTDRCELAWLDRHDWRRFLTRTVTLPDAAEATVRAVVTARVRGRNRVGWVGGTLDPAAFAERVARLVCEALS